MKVKCNHCGAIITIDGSKDIAKQEIIDEKAEVIAAYVKCPECNNDVCFQVDNMYTINLANTLSKQIRKVEVLKAKKKFDMTLYKEVNRNINKLKFTQAFLEKKYSDKLQVAKIVKDEDDNV